MSGEMTRQDLHQRVIRLWLYVVAGLVVLMVVVGGLGSLGGAILRDQERLKLALHQLNSTGAPVDEVARNLGFSSGRAFRRALKRWTGKSPSALRTG